MLNKIDIQNVMNIFEKILNRLGYRKIDGSINQEIKTPVKNNFGLPSVGVCESIIVPEFQLTTGEKSLALHSTEFSTLPHNYAIIPMSEEQKRNAYNALSVGAAGTNSAIAGKMLSGLYRATADPATLMKLSSGGVGSAVVENGKIVGQAGFTAAGAAAAAPVVIFQALSIVTGQYYLNDIKKQLKQLNSRIEKLIQMQESANRGELDSICIFLRQLDAQEYYSIDDILLLRGKMLDIQALYFNYVEQMKIIAQDESLESMIKEGKFKRNSKQIKNTIEEYRNQDFSYLAQMANACYQIYTMMEILYFKMIAKNCDYSSATIEKINRIISDFSSEKKEEHIALFEKVESKVMNFVETKANDAFWGQTKALGFKDSIATEFDAIANSFENDELNEIKIKIAEPFKKQQEIYYDLSVPGQASIYISKS